MSAPPPGGLRGGVLHAVHGWPLDQLGGVGVVVDALCAAEAAAGRPVAVLAPSGGWRWRPRARWQEGLPPVLFVDRGGGLGARASWEQPAALDAVGAALERLAPAALHVHHLAGLPLGLPALARRMGLRVRITLHDYHFVCPRGQLLDARGAPCPGPAPDRCAGCLGLRGPTGPAAVRARREVVSAQLAGATVESPSADLAERFERFGLPRPTVCALPPPAWTAAPRPATRQEAPLRALFLGALHPSKGPDLLLEAALRLPRGALDLRLAGPDGPDRAFVQRIRGAVEEARAAGRAVRLDGALPRAEVPAALAGADLLVVPSRWAENSPLVVREAMAAGLRTLVPAWGGARELDAGALVFGAPRREPPRGPARDQVIVAAIEAELRRALFGGSGDHTDMK
ncbi:MAG: glycosyltransferase [Deltaproteobacteria bacterium]|nr:glycosyltransferase [Deltaproteobacteria bacterium]